MCPFPVSSLGIRTNIWISIACPSCSLGTLDQKVWDELCWARRTQMCKTQLTTADLMTKHQDQRRKCHPTSSQTPNSRLLNKTQQSRAWNSNIFVEESEDLRGETPQPAPATSRKVCLQPPGNWAGGRESVMIKRLPRGK